MTNEKLRVMLDEWEKSGEPKTSLYYRLLQLWITAAQPHRTGKGPGRPKKAG